MWRNKREDPNDFPFDLHEALGEVMAWERLCPGVYYLGVRRPDSKWLPDEYYLVERSSPAISQRAQAYGAALPGYPELLAYCISREGSGWQIIQYEVGLYQLKLAPSQEGAQELEALALYGKETNPEYFGRFEPPEVTPWGRSVSSKCLANGVFWIETSGGGGGLSVCYPVWQGDLSESTSARLGKQNPGDRGERIHQTMGPLFFPERSSAIPLYELFHWRPEWQETELIHWPALMNAIWMTDPAYALENNLRAWELPGDLEQKLEQYSIITYTPGVGTDFLYL